MHEQSLVNYKKVMRKIKEKNLEGAQEKSHLPITGETYMGMLGNYQATTRHFKLRKEVVASAQQYRWLQTILQQVHHNNKSPEEFILQYFLKFNPDQKQTFSQWFYTQEEIIRSNFLRFICDDHIAGILKKQFSNTKKDKPQTIQLFNTIFNQENPIKIRNDLIKTLLESYGQKVDTTTDKDQQ